MSVTHVSAELRRLVVTRADGLCEYCLIAEEDTFYGCQVDHIISEKHGGPTQGDNLSYACVFCNQAKGSDVGSIHWQSGAFLRFFNPRIDRWADHFELRENCVFGMTPVGRATVRLLNMNAPRRVDLRRSIGP